MCTKMGKTAKTEKVTPDTVSKIGGNISDVNDSEAKPKRRKKQSLKNTSFKQMQKALTGLYE